MKPTYKQLEQQVLDLSVQLANAESKCRELAAFGADPAAIVPVMYKGIELLKKDGLELIRDGVTEPTGLEAMCMAKALLSALPTPAVTQNHHKWSPGLVHPEDCQCGDCRSAKLNYQSSNSFTDEDLEMMAHGNNPQSNAYRELLVFRRNSPATQDC